VTRGSIVAYASVGHHDSQGLAVEKGYEVYFGKYGKWEVYFSNLTTWEVYFRSFPLL
jgi:hypothetical protein